MEIVVPVAALYPDLKDFFVDVLGVNTVTPAFMIKELARAASKRQKNINEIKNLMLSASELLDVNSKSSDFRVSMESLEESKFLPCKLISGNLELRSVAEQFFIVDKECHAVFNGQLIILDFTYEQLNSLHDLFRILRLDNRYLSRHVSPETSADTSSEDDILTEQFRQCAYAISR